MTNKFPGFWAPDFWKPENQRKPVKTWNLMCRFADARVTSIDARLSTLVGCYGLRQNLALLWKQTKLDRNVVIGLILEQGS